MRIEEKESCVPISQPNFIDKALATAVDLQCSDALEYGSILLGLAVWTLGTLAYSTCDSIGHQMLFGDYPKNQARKKIINSSFNNTLNQTKYIT